MKTQNFMEKIQESLTIEEKDLLMELFMGYSITGKNSEDLQEKLFEIGGKELIEHVLIRVASAGFWAFAEKYLTLLEQYKLAQKFPFKEVVKHLEATISCRNQVC